MSDPNIDEPPGSDALRRSAILERVTEGIVALDADFRYTYVTHLPHPQSGSNKKKRLGTRSAMMAVHKRTRRFVLRV